MKPHRALNYVYNLTSSEKASLTICTSNMCNVKRVGDKAVTEMEDLRLAAVNPVEYLDLGHSQNFLKEKEICFKTSHCSKITYRPIYFWKQRVSLNYLP